MEEKYILVLGAGLMQRPAIQAVKELGYKVIVVDANSSAVCVGDADIFECIDLKDKEGLAKFALSLGAKLKAVFTAGTDFSSSVAYVAEKCGLKSHSFESAMAASDKILMRSCFARDNVSSPAFCQVDSSTDVTKLNIQSYPMVIKPVDSMGARGCRMIRSESEKIESIQLAIDASRSGRAILEEYMDGMEFSIDALVYDGTLTVTGFADRHIYYPPYFIEMGHTLPSCIDESKKKELLMCFADAVHSLGLTHGAAKADIKYTKKGPMIGEIAGRMSGGYMSGWTYPYASDFNLTKQGVCMALGEIPSELLEKRKQIDINHPYFKVYEVECVRVSAERAWISIPGVVSKIYGIDEAKSISGVRDVLPRNYEGDSVIFPINNVSKCGNIIAVADSYSKASDIAEDAVSEIVLRLEPGNSMTDAFVKANVFDEGFPPEAFPDLVLDIDRNIFIDKDLPYDYIIPECVKPYVDTIKDYNHRTINKTLSLLQKIVPQHGTLNLYDFWSRIKASGIQGALYMIDTLGN